MHDPFPFQPPELLKQYVEPVAEYLNLRTLPLHFHEVFLAFLLYTGIHQYIAPAISKAVIPRQYAAFNARTRLNWNVHIVSFTQSTLICSMALWVMWVDDERREMNWAEKVHGYTGAGGLIQALAGGYFMWDLVITLQNMNMFGPGMLAHAVSALFVFSLGFRPFVNFYAPTFILYELSSPFLNIHWFCDKLNMTGSKVQLYNGFFLLATFFGCRLCWGSYQSTRVFYDVYRAIFNNELILSDAALSKSANGTTLTPSLATDAELMHFAGDRTVPIWLATCYLGANVTLNGLNWFWFSKMIETIRKRFDPPIGTRRPEEKAAEEKRGKILDGDKVLVEGTHVESPPPSMPTTPFAHATGADGDYIGALKLEKTGAHLEVEQSEIRKRGGAEKTIGTARAA